MADDLMPTFRQKIKLNNEELIYFHQDVNSWREKLRDVEKEEPSTLEDLCYDLSSEDDIDSDPAEDLMKEGNKYLQKGEWTRAISFYSSAISRKNNVAQYYANRALGHLKRNSLAEAEKDCTHAIHLRPEYKKAYLRRAYAKKQLGKCKESCDDFEIVLKMEPDHRIALAEYEAMIEYIQKDLLSDETVQGDVTRQDKTEIAVKTKQQGNKLIERGDYVGAKAKFTTAIKLDSNDPTFYANRAICHMKLMDFKKAENDCDRALELNWKYVKAYIRRARIRRKLGKMYEARQDFYNAYELNPKDATILDELEELDEVIRKLEEARRRKGIIVEEVGIVSLLESRKTSGDINKMITLKWNELRPKLFRLEGTERNMQDAKLTPKDDSISRTFLNDNNESVSLTVRTNKVEDSKQCMKELLTQGVKDNSGSSKTHGQVNNIACYNMKEVFPLKRNDPSVKFPGTLFKVRVEDAKFAVPATLFEVPDGLIL